jgi:hypothetical protein
VILVFTVLIFGLSSAPRIYTHFADVIEQIVHKKDETLFTSHDLVQLIRHYLDDFFGGHSNRESSMHQFELFLRVLDTLNVPYNPAKCSVPSQVQKILGFVFDTTRMVVRIPDAKYEAISVDLHTLITQRSIVKRKLLSIIGKLRWFSTTMFGAQAFVRRMEDRANRVKRVDNHVKIDSTIRKDVQFWLDGFRVLNRGLPIDFILKRASDTDITVYTDASSKIGMGAVDCQSNYLQIKWTTIWPRSTQIDIFFAEMLAIVAFTQARATSWSGKSIRFYCDNEAVEWSLRKKSCCFERRDVAHLIRTLCRLAITHQFYFWVERVSSDDNSLADALSRFDTVKLTQITSNTDWSQFQLTSAIDHAIVLDLCKSCDEHQSLFLSTE